MNKTIEISLSPQEAFDDAVFKQALYQKLRIKDGDNVQARVLKRSIDARSRNVQVKILVELIPGSNDLSTQNFKKDYQDVSKASKVIIVGSGPAGLFAALRLIELGIKPIVLERGKDVQARRRDIAAINKEHIVNPESNYCFGEGGAGTYSDGKLYTRSNKRGDIDRILNLFVKFGAADEILYQAHPHIGTNKLPQIITAMRNKIIDCGGEFLFEKKVIDFIIDDEKIKSVKTADENIFEADAFILATGHSARDIFELLHKKQILIEAKAFALGVRIEHPQELIDNIQYHLQNRLPACFVKPATLHFYQHR